MNIILRFLVVVFISASFIPAETQAQTAHNSVGTNVNINGTIWFITPHNCKAAYTSAAAFLSYGFKFSDVASPSDYDRALPICEQSINSQTKYGKFIAPQSGKVVCSDRGSDKGTCYLMALNTKHGFISKEIFLGRGYSFDNVLYGDVSWMSHSADHANISSIAEAHLRGVPFNHNGTIVMYGEGKLLIFPDPPTLFSFGYTFSDVVPATSDDKAAMASMQVSVQGHRTAGQLHPLY